MKLLDKRWAPLAIAMLFGLAAVAAGVLVGQTNAEQAQLAARWTARAALPIFLTAYIASTALQLWPGDLSRAILRRRRQWGLGFALAHTIHLAALAFFVINFEPRSVSSLIPGGFAYLLIFAMTLTSNNASMRLLGKNWKRLHMFGIHYIWLIFTLAYAKRIAEPETMATGLISTPILLGVLGIRLYAWRQRTARPVNPAIAH